MRNERGFILLLTFAFLIVLVQMVAAMTILLGSETLDIGAQRDDKQILYLADAGVERALREIRNDSTSPGHQSGTAHLRAALASGVGITQAAADRVRYEEDSVTSLASNESATLWRFDSTIANARIVSVSIGVRASRSTSTVQLSYTTDGSTFVNAGSNIALTGTMTDYSVDVTSDRSWTWATILNDNFKIKCLRTDSGGGSVSLSQLYLKMSYEIDTKTEAWFTGSYQSYPFSLGAGTVQSVSVTDEQAKIHLNTASQTLLNNFFLELGVASGTASTLSANIVTYRGTKSFDSVEELQQVTGMTAANYNLIKDTVTVYSFINTNAYSNTASPRSTTVARAPVNINTASQQVLEAIFDDANLSLAAGDAATLATDIVTARTAAPFTCFYNRDASVTTSFYDFVKTQETFLTVAQRNRVVDNADPSALIPVQGFSGYLFDTGTEFCYASSAFKVESVATVGGRNMRVKRLLADQNLNTFTTFNGDTTSTGTRKENFE